MSQKPLLETMSSINSTLTYLLVGIIFGMFPAYKASNLKPIDALRFE